MNKRTGVVTGDTKQIHLTACLGRRFRISRVVSPLIVVLTLCASGAEARVDPADKCYSQKLKATAAGGVAVLRCYAKAQKRGVAVDPDCTAKALDRLAASHARATEKGGCGVDVDAADTQLSVEGFADESRLLVVGALSDSSCAAQKLVTVAAYLRKAALLQSKLTTQPAKTAATIRQLSRAKALLTAKIAGTDASGDDCLSVTDPADVEDLVDRFLAVQFTSLLGCEEVSAEEFVSSGLNDVTKKTFEYAAAAGFDQVADTALCPGPAYLGLGVPLRGAFAAVGSSTSSEVLYFSTKSIDAPAMLLGQETGGTHVVFGPGFGFRVFADGRLEPYDILAARGPGFGNSRGKCWTWFKDNYIGCAQDIISAGLCLACVASTCLATECLSTIPLCSLPCAPFFTGVDVGTGYVGGPGIDCPFEPAPKCDVDEPDICVGEGETGLCQFGGYCGPTSAARFYDQPAGQTCDDFEDGAPYCSTTFPDSVAHAQCRDGRCRSWPDNPFVVYHEPCNKNRADVGVTKGSKCVGEPGEAKCGCIEDSDCPHAEIGAKCNADGTCQAWCDTNDHCDATKGETCVCLPDGCVTGDCELYCAKVCSASESSCDNRFTDNGDGTITDHQTGLMWEKKDDSGGIHDMDSKYTWSGPSYGTTNEMDGTAFTEFLPALNAAGFAGYTDWRMPTIDELETLVDPSRTYCINNDYNNCDPNPGYEQPVSWCAFNDSCEAGCAVVACSCTYSYRYWSATSQAPGIYSNEAFGVNFRTGSTVDSLKKSERHVRAVRAGS